MPATWYHIGGKRTTEDDMARAGRFRRSYCGRDGDQGFWPTGAPTSPHRLADAPVVMEPVPRSVQRMECLQRPADSKDGRRAPECEPGANPADHRSFSTCRRTSEPPQALAARPPECDRGPRGGCKGGARSPRDARTSPRRRRGALSLSATGSFRPPDADGAAFQLPL
jgi:hypothetical protein